MANSGGVAGRPDAHALVHVLAGRTNAALAREDARIGHLIEQETRAQGFSERCVPSVSPLVYVSEHVERYMFAQPWVVGKRVLDVACGSGYGSAVLARMGASWALGLDLDGDAARYAHLRYAGRSTGFGVADAQRLPLRDGSVDVVTTFETIEHVPDAGRFLGEVARVLAPDGVAVISTPNRLVSSPGHEKPLNPFHLREFEPQEFLLEVGRHFESVELHGQTQPPAALRPQLIALGRRVLTWVPGGGAIRRRLSKRISPWSSPRLVPEGLAALQEGHGVLPFDVRSPRQFAQLVAVARRPRRRERRPRTDHPVRSGPFASL